MDTWVSKGKCNLCGVAFSRVGMARHPQSCLRKAAASELQPVGGNLKPEKLLHLAVCGSYDHDYWMNLEMRGRSTLRSLDTFLRDTWLECCGHLSQFKIEGRRYGSCYGEDPGFDRDMGNRSMNVRLDQILSLGLTFEHEYDFGTTTELTLRVVSERDGTLREKGVRVLARNEPPPIACHRCGKLATVVCTYHMYQGEGWLCDECRQEHTCGEGAYLPVVNSPRVGMCGYTGGAWR